LAEYQRLLGPDLEGMAGAWMVARRLREFLAAWEAQVAFEERGEVARDWLERARAYAEKLDPLLNAKPFRYPSSPQMKRSTNLSYHSKRERHERKRSGSFSANHCLSASSTR
jgi:hypothetical protein